MLTGHLRSQESIAAWINDRLKELDDVAGWKGAVVATGIGDDGNPSYYM